MIRYRQMYTVLSNVDSIRSPARSRSRGTLSNTVHRAHDADILITNINTRSPFVTPVYFSSHTPIYTNPIQVSTHPKDV
jgi:hypothetical protein